ncbi:Phosphate transporter PHO1-10-like protein [Morus notabilis]|uniref:Phosphate transporter PHO1-10-like protein n=1 Tax=Morus notabilis TaxID=981085 RepID=W9SPK3_9ROSA|nr:Phosphate transporter PHO1-10-like protein [Morus notabilis]
MNRTLSGLNCQSSSNHSNKDIEDQVIDINTLPRDGSRRIFETNFLRKSEEGAEIEVTFFRKLDEELNKVSDFYKDKVEEVIDGASQLNKQMEARVALRIKVGKQDFERSNSNRSHQQERTQQSSGASKHVSVYANSGSSGSREEVKVNNNQNQDQDRLEVLEHVKINSTIQSPISTIKGTFRHSKDDELSFGKEDMRKAEEQLKVAFIEFYHKLYLLKQYSFVNLSAFSKIMKKYEKITSRRAYKLYMEIVDNSCLGNSDEIIELLERVETTFIKNFSNSNHTEGMKSLRPKRRREKHRVTFVSGFFSGCTVMLLVAIVLRIEYQKLLKKEGMQYMQSIFPLYSVFLYIVLHMLVYAANIYFWRRYRINNPFIFGFKRGTELGYREVFLLSTGLAVLALSGFLANLHLDMNSSTQEFKKVTELVPLGLVTLVLLILVCPFNILYRSSRFFFIRCLFRCILAPLYPMTFPDYFLADQLTSQMQALRSSVLYVCYYGLGEYSRRQNKCHKHGVYNTLYFVIAIVPYWLRFLQCLRRLFEDKDAMHGYNGLTYLSTIVAVLVRTAFELKGGVTWMVFALISSTVAMIVNAYWDIVFDWGLLRRHSKNIYLRDRLLVSHKSVYIVAMVLDIVLRLAWMQLMLAFNLHTVHKLSITTTVFCLEIIRRGIWNFFRYDLENPRLFVFNLHFNKQKRELKCPYYKVTLHLVLGHFIELLNKICTINLLRLENEHLNNVGKYGAFRSVPLPFSYYDENDDKDD